MSEDQPLPQPNPQLVAVESKRAARAAIAELTVLVRECEPLQLISRVALYMMSGNPDIPEPERPDRNEAHLEYLISLATAFPYPCNARSPSPHDVQATIDLLTDIHQRASVHHLFSSRDESSERGVIADIANSFRLDRLHIRGDAFWVHLRRTMHDLLEPHDEKLRELLGFDSSEFFAFFDRAERNINDRLSAEHEQRVLPYILMTRPWRNVVLEPHKCSAAELAAFEGFTAKNVEQFATAKADFDSFGTPSLFVLSAETPSEAHILASLSSGFGENQLFHGTKPDHAFWPLTDSLTDLKPVIRHDSIYYGFHLPKIQRGTFTLISSMVRNVDTNFWHKRFLPTRDAYLERETASLLRRALPSAKVFTSMGYEVSDPKEPNKVAEADVLVVCDDVLLIVECKAASLRASTHRGGVMSTADDLRETIVRAQTQALRLVQELAQKAELTLRSKNGGETVVLRAVDLRTAICVSVTMDLMSSVSTSLWILEEAGLLTSTSKCWAVSLNDLRVVVDILDRPALFLHYLRRRLDLNVIRRVSSRDELDLLMHYVERGLFFREQNEPGENEKVMIANFTQDLEQYYRRVEGISSFGKKPRVRMGRRTKQMLATIESARPPNYLSACLALLEFDTPDRELLLSKLNEHLALLRKGTAAYALSLTANSRQGEGVLLVTSRTPSTVKDAIYARAIELCRQENLKELCVILQGVPPGKPPISIFFAHPDGVPSHHGIRLLQQLKRESIEFRGS